MSFSQELHHSKTFIFQSKNVKLFLLNCTTNFPSIIIILPGIFQSSEFHAIFANATIVLHDFQCRLECYKHFSFFSNFQVLAPNDVQFALPLTNEGTESQTPEEDPTIVIQSNTFDTQTCVDTSAFVGVTITFLMILIVALITILFLWLRIKSLDSSSAKKRCF